MFFGKFKPTAKVSEMWEFIVTNPELIGNNFSFVALLFLLAAKTLGCVILSNCMVVTESCICSS